MSDYTNVAKEKVAELIRRDDFAKIVSISDDKVIIEFTHDTCVADSYGKVVWKDNA